MPRRQGKPRKRRSSSLSDHKRHRKTLTPPLLALPGQVIDINWRNRLPNMLWLGALLHEYPGDWRVVDALETLDACIGRESEILDGRLTSFELVSPKYRAAARRELLLSHPRALPDGLGHALALVDASPGRWLYEDWAFESHHDRSRGIAYLRQLIVELADSRGEFAIHARMLSLGRYLEHGRLVFTRETAQSADVLSRYPSRCTEAERIRARQFAKTTYDAIVQANDLDAEEEWGRLFWREAARLARSGNPAARGLA